MLPQIQAETSHLDERCALMWVCGGAGLTSAALGRTASAGKAAAAHRRIKGDFTGLFPAEAGPTDDLVYHSVLGLQALQMLLDRQDFTEICHEEKN
ncbi:hypothetical protein [Pseudomonas graminis]|uniref:hypothetical protein n=1 Tax=Pseudomonas graminis TaxID=158627 RepID=UPI0015870363|nr:hypothetical protein [Pseudomonas graminis]